jgi:hypothetical protein
MAKRQIEVRVVNVSYTPATSPEDAAMVRAGISLLLKMMVKAKAREKNTDEGNVDSCSVDQIAACEEVFQPGVTFAGVIGQNTSIDNLTA